MGASALLGPWGLVDLFRSGQIGSSRRGEPEDKDEICNTIYILFKVWSASLDSVSEFIL